MDWEECKYKRFIKEINCDNNLINSLIKSSNDKLKSFERLGLDEITASTKISIIYDSLREILEALAIRKNLKIYNHECFCAFLDEICNDKLFSDEFDRFRKLRNKINYYGKQVQIDEAKIIIEEMILLREKIVKKYFRDENESKQNL